MSIHTKRALTFILAVIAIPLLAGAAGSSDITWQSIGPGAGGAITAIAIDPTNENIVYVGTDIGGMFKSTDGGQNYHFINNGLKDLGIQKIVINPNNSNVIFSGTEGGLYKSTNGGESWEQKTNGFIKSGANMSYPVKAIAIDPNNSNVMYAGLAQAGGNNYVTYSTDSYKYKLAQIYKSTDGGENWTVINTGSNKIETPAYIFELAVSPSDSNVIYATTETGFYKSTDSGVNWTKKTTGLPLEDTRGLTVSPQNPNIIYITLITPTGTNPWQGGVYKSTDGGETWQAKNTGLKDRNDSGNEAMTSNYPDVVVDSADSNTVYSGDWAYGESSVRKSVDGGDSWARAIKYTYDSKTKTLTFNNIQISHILMVAVSALAVSNSNPNVIYFGTSMWLYKSVDGGNSWTLSGTKHLASDKWQTGGIENTCLLSFALDPGDPNTVYFNYADIGPFKSTDGGITFSTIRNGMSKGSDNYWGDVTSMVFDPDDSSILYAAGSPGNGFTKAAVMKSLDAGSTWSVIGTDSTGLPVANAVLAPILIDPQSLKTARTIYVGKNGSGVYKSTNGGATWVTMNNGLPVGAFVSALAQDKNNPQTIYLGTAGQGNNGPDGYGRIYKTTNGGASWAQIDIAGLFADVSTLVIDPKNDSIIYAGARSHWDSTKSKFFAGGVFKSMDYGLTWTQILTDNKIQSIAINPQNTEIIYAGSAAAPYYDNYSLDNKLYRSGDGGINWERADSKMSGIGAGVHTIAISQADSRIIFIGTSGTGVFKGIDASLTASDIIPPAAPTGLRVN